MKALRISAIVLAVATLGLGVSAKLVDNDKYFEIIKNIEIFSNVYKELNQNYVEDIDPGVLMRTGIDAMVASLDPFTNYISETQVERYRISTQGRYEYAQGQKRYKQSWFPGTRLIFQMFPLPKF